MVQKSSSSNNIQGGQLEMAPELAPHWGPRDGMAEDASLAEDTETCAWLSWAEGKCYESPVCIYRCPETCGLWSAQLLQERYTSLKLTLKGDSKPIKTKPRHSEWSAGTDGLLFHYAHTFWSFQRNENHF